MSKIISDTIRGALKVNGLPERSCFTSFSELLAALPELLSVEIPIGSSGVIVGPDEPGEQDRGKLWLRRDNSGGVIGKYAFQGGHWERLYDVVTGEVRWIVGDSTQIPAGWELIEEGVAGFPSEVIDRLVSTYVPNVNIAGAYYYFAVHYVGF